MTIQTSPKTITVYGDSYSVQTYAADEGVVYSPASSFSLGLGGTDAIVACRSAGGTSLREAVSNTGNWLNVGAGAAIQNQFTADLSGYVVLRYGINDVLEHTQNYPDSVFGSFGERRYHFETTFGADLRTAATAAQAAGKKVILWVPPNLPVNASGAAGWEWTATSQRLVTEGILPQVVAVAGDMGLRYINQNNLSYTTSQEVDWLHLKAAHMHDLSIDFGQRLRTAITGY
jgi:hypothetical protein